MNNLSIVRYSSTAMYININEIRNVKRKPYDGGKYNRNKSIKWSGIKNR